MTYWQTYSNIITFTVHNNHASQTLYPLGSTPLTMTNDTNHLTITTPLPTTPIPPGGSSDFVVGWAVLPTAGTSYPETVTLKTGGPTNHPFTFTLFGSYS